MSWPSPVAAQLAGYSFETLLFGCFLVIFVQCVNCLRARQMVRKRIVVNRWMIIAACALFLCITAHWIINTVRLGQALVRYGEQANPGPLQNYITRLTQTGDDCVVLAIQDALWLIEALIGDSILTYRLYVMWGGNRAICLLPCFTVLSEFGFAVAAIIEDTRQNALTIWILITFGLNVFTNLYCTALISFRIWRNNRQLRKLNIGQPKGQFVTKLLLESAAIYTIANLLLLFTFASNSNLQFFFTDPSSPAIGVVFCTIIVRARAQADMTNSSVETRTESGLGGNTFTDDHPPRRPLSALDIRVDRHVSVEGGLECDSEVALQEKPKVAGRMHSHSSSVNSVATFDTMQKPVNVVVL